MTSWILDWPFDKLKLRLAKWHVGFYLGQMTNPISQMTCWILPWPNDKCNRQMTSPICTRLDQGSSFRRCACLGQGSSF